MAALRPEHRKLYWWVPDERTRMLVRVTGMYKDTIILTVVWADPTEIIGADHGIGEQINVLASAHCLQATG
jgi:hypothetical protein